MFLFATFVFPLGVVSVILFMIYAAQYARSQPGTHRRAFLYAWWLSLGLVALCTILAYSYFQSPSRLTKEIFTAVSGTVAASLWFGVVALCIARVIPRHPASPTPWRRLAGMIVTLVSIGLIHFLLWLL